MCTQVGVSVTLGCAVGDREEREELVVCLGLVVQCLCIGFEFLLAGKRAGVLVLFVCL